MSSEAATVTAVLRGPRGLLNEETVGKMYEPLIDFKNTLAEIDALDAKNKNPSFIVSDEELFKVFADVYHTVRAVTGNHEKHTSVKVSNTRIAFEELPQNLTKGPIEAVRVFYSDAKGDRILTLSRHGNGRITIGDIAEDDLDKEHSQPRTILERKDKGQLLEALLSGMKNLPEKPN